MDAGRHWVTEYGGEVLQMGNACIMREVRVCGPQSPESPCVHHSCAHTHMQVDPGADSHIISTGCRDICLDSRVRDKWDMDYYTV